MAELPLNLQDLSEDELLALSVLYVRRKRRKNIRRFWVHPILQSRKTLGEFHRLVLELKLDGVRFTEYFRMSPTQFEHLVNLVSPAIQKDNTNYREAITASERLAICLRFLASGDSYRSLAFSYRIGRSTVGEIVSETCQALWEVLVPTCMKCPDEATWSMSAKRYAERWNFPNCVGAIDGKHVIIQTPANSGSAFFNYKGTFSIVLLAVVDADYRFTVIDVGCQGRNSDGGTLANSAFGKLLSKDQLKLPQDTPLPGQEHSMPYVIVADEAFPLRRNMMRPFPGTAHGNLATEQRIFNYRLSRARRVVENAFGILSSRWRVYRRVLATSPENADKVVKATCILHNYLHTNDPMTDQIEANRTPSAGLQPINRVGSNNSTQEANDIRKRFMEYFNSPEGSVAWQTEHINRTN